MGFGSIDEDGGREMQRRRIARIRMHVRAGVPVPPWPLVQMGREKNSVWMMWMDGRIILRPDEMRIPSSDCPTPELLTGTEASECA
jgi:hypothetical protein